MAIWSHGGFSVAYHRALRA